jgi:hypothetical protein
VQPSEAAAALASERHEVPGVGAANAQNAAGYLQQQYNGYYAQCMASRRYPPTQYSGPASGYAQAPGYSPTPSYGPPPGYSSSATSNDLNRQELNRLYGPALISAALVRPLGFEA